MHYNTNTIPLNKSIMQQNYDGAAKAGTTTKDARAATPKNAPRDAPTT
jgi:hypothetical protein